MTPAPRSVLPYGTWPSPISAARVAAGALRLSEVRADGDALYWIEGRPAEAGRAVVMCAEADGTCHEVMPAHFNARTRVHEYGGGALCVDGGVVYASHFADQRLYARPNQGELRPLTAEGCAFADACPDPARARLIVVREDARSPDREPRAAIVAVGTDGRDRDGHGVVLVDGADFYSDPIVSPDGQHMAWLQWTHPQMPWDGTELWVGTFDAGGGIRDARLVTGGPRESVFQPTWSRDGVLHLVSDRSGWWNLYQARPTAEGAWHLHALCPRAADFGKPQWVFSMTTYAHLRGGRVAATYVHEGRWRLCLLDPQTGAVDEVPMPLDVIESMVAAGEGLACVAGSPTETPAVVRLSWPGPSLRIVRRSTVEALPPACVSVPVAVQYTAPCGASGQDARTVHAFYYPPAHPDVTGPSGAAPPLLVMSHGGPTSAADPTLDLKVQFWTSRGFAVLDVNYSGSTGFGRAYRDRLKGQWGLMDVEDVVAGAVAMADTGRADRARLAIRGGSAGGLTTLAALMQHRVFGAGASYYGVTDLEVLAEDTHKFEARYLDSLVGPYPECRDAYVARSPVHLADRLRAPVILFQGMDDRVVPPNQTVLMAEAARRQGVPVACVMYPGESHGFRQAATLVHALESELVFYGRVFGFTPAGPLPPLTIDGLP